jgi:pimeloyl-ACP methyl ester carboxylesterase
VAQEVCVAGKRKVAWDSWGSPTGMPVFLLHGTPGSHSGPRPRSSVLYRLGVRLVSYDRPGYGGSDPYPGRTVADAVGDIEAIADRLKLDKFGVLGRSGGGPHALACAALLADRVERVACLVGLAPSDAEGLDWYSGMTKSNTWEFKKAEEETNNESGDGHLTARRLKNGHAAHRQLQNGNTSDLGFQNGNATNIRTHLAEQAQRIREDPEELLRTLTDELAHADGRVVNDLAIRRLLTDTYQEAVRKGADGWIDDVVALRRPWRFDLATIKVPVLLWHGANDVFSPVAHTDWLAQQIPGAMIAVQPDAAHFNALEIMPSVLAWIKNPGSSEGLGIQNAHQPALMP